MKVEAVSFLTLPDAAFAGLLKSTHHSAEQFAYELASNKSLVFVVDPVEKPVYFAVSLIKDKGMKVLSVEGIWVQVPGSGWRWKSWLKFLRRLAADWGCTKIETTVRDERQLTGLIRLGCAMESATVCLEI